MARRRDLMRWSAAAGLGLLLPGATAAVASQRRPAGPAPRAAGPTPSPTPSPGPPPGAFTEPLPIPPVLQPVSTDGGVDRYEIRQTVARQRIRPDAETEIWGYEGQFPGPTIEARRGRPVIMTHHNELPVPTVVHLHGAVAAPEHDGWPADFVLPPTGDWANDPELASHAAHTIGGVTTGSRDYEYPNDQPAATLWYHDHRMSFGGPQQYQGLVGLYLIRDDLEDELPLPRGDREVPLVLADRTFNEDGSLFYPALDPTGRTPGVAIEYHHSGMIGETITVNGVAWPFLEVDAARYRLRFVNASNARQYRLALDPPPPGGRGLLQIGSDLGLLQRPAGHDDIPIAPGERYDVVVDFGAYRPGTMVTLRNTLADGPAGYVMRFEVARRVTDDALVPETLGAQVQPPTFEGKAADRSFSFISGPEGTVLPGMINFRPYNPERIDAHPGLSTTEVWDLTADPSHPVHLHLAHFRVLQRDGGPPAPQDAGWKDTVFIPEGGVRVAVTFSGFRGKYVFHCHNLEHADAGMMANMEIV